MPATIYITGENSEKCNERGLNQAHFAAGGSAALTLRNRRRWVAPSLELVKIACGDADVAEQGSQVDQTPCDDVLHVPLTLQFAMHFEQF